MAGRGRKRVLTKKFIKEFSDVIYLGATYRVACDYCNVSVASVMAWKKKGEEIEAKIENGEEVPKEDLIYLEFLEQTRKAKGELAVDLLEEIKRARELRDINSSWRMLSSNYKGDYSPSSSVELTGKDGNEINLRVSFDYMKAIRPILSDEENADA